MEEITNLVINSCEKYSRENNKFDRDKDHWEEHWLANLSNGYHQPVKYDKKGNKYVLGIIDHF